MDKTKEELREAAVVNNNSEEKLKRINEIFLSFGPDSEANINRLVALCGELINADCALYNRLEGDTLHACGRWKMPSDFKIVDNAKGHICYDVIMKSADSVILIRDLKSTDYARSDPNVLKYNLKTYIGRAVKFGDKYIGTLCAVYQRDFIPTEEDKRVISIISSAIGIEEERQGAVESGELAEFTLQHVGDMIFWLGRDGEMLYTNEIGCNILGYSKEELLALHITDINPELPKKNWPDFWEDVKERGSFSFEAEAKKKDGAIFTIEAAVNYLKFKEDEYVCWFVRDITERKKAEEHLARRDEQLEILSRTSVHINAVLEIPQIMRTLIAASIELVDATAGTAGLFIDNKMVFTEYNKNGKLYKIEDIFGTGYIVPRCVADSKRPCICNGEFRTDDPAFEFRKLKGITNFISMPIISSDGKLLGCLEIHNKEGGIPFDTQDAAMLQGITASAAVALENAYSLSKSREAEEALRFSEERFRTIFESTTDNILVWDKDYNYLYANQAAIDYVGSTRDKVIGKNIRDGLGHMPDFMKLWMSRVDKIFAMRKPMRVEDSAEVGGKVVYSESVLAPLFDSSGKVFAVGVVYRDVTARKKSEEELKSLNSDLRKANEKFKQLALKDPQTGLYNYRYLTEVIESEFYRARRYAHPLSVVMIDIDYFKSINDLYGHAFGDIVLKELATQLKKMVRKYDIVIRAGGEEFIIISPGVDRARALALAQRLLDAINLYNFGDKNHIVKLKLSISVASYPDDNIIKGADLINLADKILNKAKEKGGNRTYSSFDMAGGKSASIGVEPETNDVKFLKDKIDKLSKRSKQSLIESIFAFAKTIELKDHYTGEHAESTVRYSTQIARALELSPEEIENIRQASTLHDLGKIGISDKILLKKSKLTKKEFTEIKKHPQIAADIIRPIQFMHDIIPLVLYHHERWDGKGYSSGLRGDEIPIGARIIAIADVYQALTSNRPYRKAFSAKEALNIIKKGAGTQFDPRIVGIFLNIMEKNRRGKNGRNHRRK